MLPTFPAYPQFAPNQILTSKNLNQLYDYLYEQERLTRTHLIGIGIVCGLEASLNEAGNQLTISRGCGVTSAGHLIIWDEDEPLEFRRPYTMPEDIDYTFFNLPGDPNATYPLWELTTDRDDDGEAVALTRNFLTGTNQDTDAGEGDEKVLLLLFECRAVDNSNCTPTSCDDKGRTVETAVRPLLIRRGDLEEIRRVLAEDHPGVEAYYALGQSYADRLALPTLRGPRFDVPNTSPITTRDVLTTYTRALSSATLTGVQAALDAAFETLSPLLPDYPANPFAGRITGLSFVPDGSLLDSPDAVMIQYYYDHLLTVIHAYDELRARAEELFGLCCPDPDIFPRHLVLHTFTDAGVTNGMRHNWVSSPVQNRQIAGRRELLHLFERLVYLVTDTQLPTPDDRTRPAVQGIRITPSFLNRPLSRKAIPFYYDPANLPGVWNPALTAVGRSDENLGFRANEWNSSDDFVRNPLLYDLEPRNFLRIEGAIGEDYRTAVAEIRRQIDTYRLPIDVVALRTGRLQTGLQIEEYDLHFGDLQSQYVVLRESLLGRLAEVLVRIYDTKILSDKQTSQPLGLRGNVQAPLLQRLPNYQFLRGTVGEFYEDHYAQHTAAAPFYAGLDTAYIAHLLLIHALAPTPGRFTPLLRDLDFAALESWSGTFLGGGRFTARFLALGLNDAQAGSPTTSPKLDLEELSDQLDELLTAGDFDALKALYAEYEDRRRIILGRQLFTNFQQDHPGLQCKAGTELGGTYVLVYHGPEGDFRPPRPGRFRLLGRILNAGQPVPGARLRVVGANLAAATVAKGDFRLQVDQLPVQVRLEVPGAEARVITIRDDNEFVELDLANLALPRAEAPIPGLTIGTVIADFYLPYRCCGGGIPIEVFPPAPPEEPTEPLTAEVRQVGCSRTMRSLLIGEVAFTASGGTPPYFLEDANGNRQPLPEEALEVFGGFAGTITDSAAGSVAVSVTLRGVVTVNLVGSPVCTDDNQRFSQDFEVIGGQPPYTFVQPDGSQESLEQGEVGTVRGIASGNEFTLIVADDSEAKCGTQVAIGPHTCTVDEPDCGLPCDGIATRASYPLWLQRPSQFTEFRSVTFEVLQLALTDEAGNAFALGPVELRRMNADIRRILAGVNGILTAANFPEVTKAILDRIATGAEDHINGPLNLPNSEPGLRLSSVNNEAFDRFNAELFDCHDWVLEVGLQYQEAIINRDARLPRRRRVTYTKTAVNFESRIVSDNQDQQSAAATSSFDRFRVNRCEPNAPAEALCRDQPSEVEIRVDGRGQGRQLSVDGDLQNLDLFWDITFGIPNLSNEQQFGVGIIQSDLTAAVHLLLVDPETGCFTVASTNIGT